MKKYNIQYGIGKAKYVVNHHNGISKHSDGSDFYDISIFSNKIQFDEFVNSLKSIGYIESNSELLLKAEKEIREYSNKEIILTDNEIPSNHLFAIRGRFCDFYTSQKYIICYLKYK